MCRFAVCAIVAVLAAAIAVSCGDPFSHKVSHIAIDDAAPAIDDAEIADAVVPADISLIDAPDAFLPADVAVIDAPAIDAAIIDTPVIDAPVIDAPVIDAPVIDAPTDAAIDAPPDAAMIDAATIDAPPGMTIDAPPGMAVDARPDAPDNDPIVENPNLVETSFYACTGSPATPLSAIPLVAAITFVIRRRRRTSAASLRRAL